MPPTLDYATKDLSRRLLIAREAAIRRMVSRNIHPCPWDAEKVMAEIQKRGWTLFMREQQGETPVAILYDGPDPQLGEYIEESRVIDREPLPSYRFDAMR